MSIFFSQTVRFFVFNTLVVDTQQDQKQNKNLHVHKKNNNNIKVEWNEAKWMYCV